MEEPNLPSPSDSLISEPLRDLPSSGTDIPVAVRESPAAIPQSSSKRPLLLWGLAGGAAFIAAGAAIFALRFSLPSATGLPSAPEVNPSATSAASPSATPSTDQLPSTEPLAVLNHLPYEEAPKSELEPITLDGILMRKGAAGKFLEMQAAAQAEGISLVPLSGFRSEEDQNHVFFDVKAQRGQDTVTRSEVSAPPGYSEHHTGYAIDIGDGDRPPLNLQTEFDSSPAYQWLKANAARYSFELSFPKNNPTGVSYEPWHWRFVGDRKSLETFYRARRTNPQVPKSE